MSVTIKDLSQTCSMAEWQVRCDLAAFHRLYAHFGWTDLIYTHLTARVPGEPDHYLIKPDLLLMDEVCLYSLLKNYLLHLMCRHLAAQATELVSS